jgi:hypothetical protein
MLNFLIPAIGKMTNLKVLELSRNPITKIGLVGMYSELIQNGVKLESLNMTGTLL